MIKYLMILSVLALAACNNSKTKEDLALEVAEHDREIRQEQATIDSLAAVNAVHRETETTHHSVNSTSSTNAGSATHPNTSAETTEKKKMSNKTKGVLIGTGAGIIGGAVTGAAVSKNKRKGAVVGGVIGGAVGAGTGYGIGAKKDNDTLK